MSHIANRHRKAATLYPTRASACTYAYESGAHGGTKFDRRWFEPHEPFPRDIENEAVDRRGAQRLLPMLDALIEHSDKYISRDRAWLGLAYLKLARVVGRKPIEMNPDELQRRSFYMLSKWVRLEAMVELSEIRHQQRTYTNNHEGRDGEPGTFARVAGLVQQPVDILIQREEIASVADAIAELPPQQASLVKGAMNEQGAAELAEAHGMKTNAAKFALNRGVWKIGESLGAWEMPKWGTPGYHNAPFPICRTLGCLFKRDNDPLALTTVEDRRHGVTVLYSVEEDAPARIIELEAAATNTGPIEIKIHRRAHEPAVEFIKRGKRREIVADGVYKIEACSKKRGQKVIVTSDAEELPEPQRLFSLTEVGKILGIDAQEVVPTMERFLLSPTAGPGGFPHYTKHCLNRVREHLERINAPADDAPEEFWPTTNDN